MKKQQKYPSVGTVPPYRIFLEEPACQGRKVNGNVLGISMYTSVSSIVSVLFWNCSDSVVFYAFQFISSIVSVLFWNYSDSVIFYVFPFISTIFSIVFWNCSDRGVFLLFFFDLRIVIIHLVSSNSS
jgi:hypothetical protein